MFDRESFPPAHSLRVLKNLVATSSLGTSRRTTAECLSHGGVELQCHARWRAGQVIAVYAWCSFCVLVGYSVRNLAIRAHSVYTAAESLIHPGTIRTVRMQ